MLSSDGNGVRRANAQACLTARLARRADTKVEVSDPTILRGRVEAQRIKVTLGITG
jgi:hypothetical protein